MVGWNFFSPTGVGANFVNCQSLVLSPPRPRQSGGFLPVGVIGLGTKWYVAGRIGIHVWAADWFVGQRVHSW